ncbi:MFS transporter, partial [Klebsiella pneumoniae]|uniref:MFS transporter n=1 Tax=Klebsiella pneumoniae TaxID=573 RepID=UPI0022470092
GLCATALIEDWGISRAEMGPILGAAMFGVAIGALVAGPLSDRYGRKRILLWSVALLALFSLAGVADGGDPVTDRRAAISGTERAPLLQTRPGA